MPSPPIPQEPPDFSLVLGGPLFQLLRRARLSGSRLELVGRRMVIISLFAWLPLALLTAYAGRFVGGQNMRFLNDIESHVRFLVALPMLIFAELIAYQRLSGVVKRFVERGVVTPGDMPRFNAAVEAAIRARNSVWLEVALVLLVYTAGHWVWQNELALERRTWYATPGANGLHLTPAGYWYSYVSIPIFQFILLRWYLRLVIWFQFLWRVSILKLRLLPTHPDFTGGIGFVGKSSYAFAPLLFSQGAMMAALIANQIFYDGDSLKSFKVTIVVLVVFCVLVILGPLTMFSLQLSNAKTKFLSEYGTMATEYVGEFDQKWLRGGAKGEDILGTSDIQSLSDLQSSYAVVRDMRIVPFSLSDVTWLVAATALPLTPLLLTIMPLEDLMMRALKIVF